MEYKEFIEIIKMAQAEIQWEYPMEYATAFDMAIQAMELQVAKKPVYSEYDDNGFDEIIPYRAECPTCGNSFEFGTWNDEENHHCVCGQKLLWE